MNDFPETTDLTVPPDPPGGMRLDQSASGGRGVIDLPVDVETAFPGLRRQYGVYLYPGSGADLAPLLLLPPGGPYGKRPFLRDEPGEDQLVLWMVDNLPLENLLEEGGCRAYSRLWQRFEARCRISGHRSIDLGPDAPPGYHYLVDVDISRSRGVVDRTRLLYSSADITGFPRFFQAVGISIEWMAFVKATGSLGGGPPADWLLPRFTDCLAPGCMPEALVGDDHFDRDGGISGYERIGSREPEWHELNANDHDRTGDLTGWGIYYFSQTVSFWPRSDRYEFYMNRLRHYQALQNLSGLQ